MELDIHSNCCVFNVGGSFIIEKAGMLYEISELEDKCHIHILCYSINNILVLSYII